VCWKIVRLSLVVCSSRYPLWLCSAFLLIDAPHPNTGSLCFVHSSWYKVSDECHHHLPLWTELNSLGLNGSLLGNTCLIVVFPIHALPTDGAVLLLWDAGGPFSHRQFRTLSSVGNQVWSWPPQKWNMATEQVIL